MILYVTKETFERYNLKLPEEMSSPIVRAVAEKVIEQETGDRLLEWGGKLFYFDRRKCLQVVNFASRLTFVLADIKVGDLENVGELIARYMLDLYQSNPKMTDILKLHFKEHPAVCFSKLKDKSAIAALNYTQRSFLQDGYRLYDYIRNGTLHTLELNRDLNRDWIIKQTVDGKMGYYYASEVFEKLMRERYAK